MARINTLSVEGDKKKGFTVTAMTDDGTLLEIKEGFEFVTVEDSNTVVDEANRLVHEAEIVQRNLVDKDAELERLRDALATARDEIDLLRNERDQQNEHATQLSNDLSGVIVENQNLCAEIGQLMQQLAAKPAETRAPMLHREYQAIPVGRTLDNLPPIDALAAAPAIPEPVIRTELGADAPARPPGPGEMARSYTTGDGVDPAPVHASDCAVRNGPADEAGPCDCGAIKY